MAVTKQNNILSLLAMILVLKLNIHDVRSLYEYRVTWYFLSTGPDIWTKTPPQVPQQD